ncbi:MAG: transposase [Bacilli bacterium]|nr:transposase [Bacilli bacterium]
MKDVSYIELENRKLDRIYFVVHCISNNVEFKDNNGSVNTRLIYTMIGMDLSGNKKYICSFFEDEYKKPSDWYSLFQKIKSRGLDKILYFVAPDNEQLKKVIEPNFEGVEVFDDYNGLIDKIKKYCISKEYEKFMMYIKKIYISKTIEENQMAIDEFIEINKDNQFILDIVSTSFEKSKDVYKYDYELRRSIYLFYFIKAVKRKIKIKMNEKNYIMSKDEFVADIFNILMHMEKYSKWHKNDVKKALNLVYETKRDMIKCYL